ncbi:hypothetical protein CAMRE0001_2922 [Campylobacter rectus RM3267]|uniref:Uncharacterized protein n=1 Tax=Campylobacter rectus RM3267 TaxID=553218 RepID=B9D280_CAMRE|nr:hypothetical protein CAMRE0001_2922 [Campylobacter rectus RM3267]
MNVGIGGLCALLTVGGVLLGLIQSGRNLYRRRPAGLLSGVRSICASSNSTNLDV